MLKSLCFLAFIASSVPVFADVSWVCSFPDQATGKVLVTGKWTVKQKTGATEAAVNSGLIEGVTGGSVQALVEKDTPKQLLVSWNLKLKNDRNQHTRMRYRLNIVQGGKKATMSAQPMGYDNMFSNFGACQKAKG